ncbi:MAG TPA: acyl-CoA dehydrogenase family protein [Myxococcota bacterium]|nr:acyl-CoA dehydrogenase family protein [Myxococcota bacterium]
MISFGPTEEQELVRDTVREFAKNEMREIARPCDEKRELPSDFLQKSWELGLVAGAIPESFGGGGIGRSPVTNALVLEELGCGDVPLAAAALAPGLFVAPLLDFGTDEQKKSLLPLFVGSSFHAATLALLEPTFSFEVSSLRTVAEPKGSGFSLSGKKRLVPLASTASHLLVVARGARDGVAGLEAFIVPRDAKGLAIAPEAERTLGFQCLPRFSVELDRVEVPASARLGGDRGIDGARLLAMLRTASAALGLGLARGVYELALPYARERVAFGQPIAQKQAIAFMLAEMQVELNSLRHLVWKAASLLEHGVDASRAATLAHVYATREVMKIADNGLQIFGGHGYIREYPVEMWYRNARALTVNESVAAL